MDQDVLILSEQDRVQLQFFPHPLPCDVFVDVRGNAQRMSQHLSNESGNGNLLFDPNGGSNLFPSAAEGYYAPGMHDCDQTHRAAERPENILSGSFQTALILGKIWLEGVNSRTSSAAAMPNLLSRSLT